jgi:transcriptional regulator with XRE-family HTH domain
MDLQVKFIDVLALFVMARRKHAGLTQVQMAERMNIHERQVRGIEAKQFVSRPALFKAAAYVHLEGQFAALGGNPNADMATLHHGARDIPLS